MKPAGYSLKKPRVSRRRVLIGLILLACLSLVAVVFALAQAQSQGSLEERIAAVNAAHALPPEQNAATIYDQLVGTKTLTGESPDAKLTPAALSGLIEASKVESCWFPLSPGWKCYMDHARRMNPMRAWTRPLANAAKRDVADRQIDAAAEKLRCLIRMGSHLQQQPQLMDFVAGTGIEGHAWSTLGESVMRPDATEELLKMAEAMPWELEDNFKEVSALTLEVVPIIAKTVLAEWTLGHRLKNWWLTRGGKSDEEFLDLSYNRLLAIRRGTRLLVGLRRYHNATGRWPDSLDEIRALVPEQALIDPYTEQTFMYRREAGEFLLYSKGANRRDDNGQHHEKADDFQIWLPRRMTSPHPPAQEAQ